MPRLSGSCSRLSQTSQTYDAIETEVSKASANSEASGAQKEANSDSPLESYLGGPLDNSLLYNYAEHAASNV